MTWLSGILITGILASQVINRQEQLGHSTAGCLGDVWIKESSVSVDFELCLLKLYRLGCQLFHFR